MSILSEVKKRKITPAGFYFYILVIFATGFFLLADPGETVEQVCVAFLLAINGASIYATRKNSYLLFVSLIIAYYNYSICIANYFDIIPRNFFLGYAGTDLSNQGLKILLAFNVLLFFVYLLVKKDTTKKASWGILTNRAPNVPILIFLAVVLVFIWVFGYTRPETAGQRGNPSTYFEYSVILLIAAFYYSGKDRLFHGIFTIIGLAYVVLNFMYGGRATGVQILLCLLFCLAIDRIPPRFLVLGGIALFLLLSMIGSMRASLSFSADSLSGIFHKIRTSAFASDTAYSAYYTSMTFLDYMSLCTTEMRLAYFARYLLSIVAGGLVPDSNLPFITRPYFMHYSGGVLPFYFYFYLGAAGILVISLYLLWLFSKLVKNTLPGSTKGIWHWIGIYVAATTFRWYIYSPSQIIRGVLILVVIFYVLRFVDRKTMPHGKASMDRETGSI